MRFGHRISAKASNNRSFWRVQRDQMSQSYYVYDLGLHVCPCSIKRTLVLIGLIVVVNDRPPDKSAYWKIIFFISHPKHMLWVLKRTVSMRRFF